MKSRMGSARAKNYFQYSNPFWYLLVLLGLYLVGASLYAPQIIPWFLGPLGNFAKYLASNYHNAMQILFIIAVFLHFFEASYALCLCRKNNLNTSSSIKWFLQTVLLGFFSLRLLISYSKHEKKKSRK